MQNNASIHIVQTVRNWFQDMAIPSVDWPLFSPDLNPIEHI
jgi:transposase